MAEKVVRKNIVPMIGNPTIHLSITRLANEPMIVNRIKYQYSERQARSEKFT
jgi:hypothetical protein